MSLKTYLEESESSELKKLLKKELGKFEFDYNGNTVRYSLKGNHLTIGIWNDESDIADIELDLKIINDDLEYSNAKVKYWEKEKMIDDLVLKFVESFKDDPKYRDGKAEILNMLNINEI